MKLAQLGVALALSASSAFAGTVEFHPDNPLQLGYGFDAKSPQTVYVSPCIEFDGIQNIDTQGGVVSGNVQISEVRSQKELLTSLGISLALEAKSGFTSGSTSFSNEVSTEFSSDSLVWIASAKINLGRVGLVNPRATQLLRGLETPEDILRVCGREIVVQENRGAIGAVVFEARGLSATEKSNLSAALAASSSGPSSGWSINSSYQTAMKSVEKTTQLSVSIFTNGGLGREALSAIVMSPNDLTVIRNSLASYVATVTPQNARPLNYITTPINQFKAAEITQPPNVQQDRLWEMYQRYLDVTAVIRHIDELTRPTLEQEEYLRNFVTDAHRARLTESRNEYESARDTIRKAGIECLRAAERCVSAVDPQLKRVTWPKIPPPPTAVLHETCLSHLVFEIGKPIPKNATTGYAWYKVALLGDREALHEVVYIHPDGVRQPLEVISSLGPEPDMELARLLAPGSSGECVGAPSLDMGRVFGFVLLHLEMKKDMPLGEIEVSEKLGRRTRLPLD